MTKLAQLIAVEKGVKNRAEKKQTELYHLIQKPQLFAGLSKTYKPLKEDGLVLPSEGVLLQAKAEDVITQLTVAVTRLIDVTASKDTSNCLAKADVTVGSKVIAAQIPVTTLIFLEKALVDISTNLGKYPTLDPAQEWVYDGDAGAYRSKDPVKTIRAKKVPQAFVKYEATEQHPAQVEVFTEEVPEGTWTKTDFSGALSADRVAGIQFRVEQLLTAVKYAREQANTIDVVDVEIGANILDFVFTAPPGEGGPKTSG